MIEKVQNAWQKQIEEVRLAGIQQGKQEGLLEGKREGLQEGKQEGKQEGLLEGKKELALQLLRSGLVDVAAISKVTAISEDEIRSWMQ